ncbi:MAG: hypothetical protein NZ898_06285 [Myxococcota bacterium]|nr:hypothetical protein [Myxococcota bacterium]MDW8363352.1 hypothetical protein [Myxococcales bacterium]
MFRVALAGAWLGLCACKVYDPTLLRDASSSTCERVVPPPRPDVSDDGSMEMVFALRDVFLDQGEAWRTTGFDLDGRCSYGAVPDVECRPPARGAPHVLDGEGGIDNSFGENLFPLVAVTLVGLEGQARAAQAAGDGTVVLRIRGYNGRADDPRVDVTLGFAVAATPGPGGGRPPAQPIFGPEGPRTADGQPLPPPQWAGEDFFWVRDDWFVMGDENRPLVRDDNAYVAGWRAVMALPERTELLFQSSAGSVVVRLTGGFAVGTLSRDLARLEPAVVAGRWAITDILQTAETVGICPGSPQYEILRNQLDRIADLRATPGTGGPGVECNAISVGVRFTGYRAHWAGLAPAPPRRDACAARADGGVDGGRPDGG